MPEEERAKAVRFAEPSSDLDGAQIEIHRFGGQCVGSRGIELQDARAMEAEGGAIEGRVLDERRRGFTIDAAIDVDVELAFPPRFVLRGTGRTALARDEEIVDAVEEDRRVGTLPRRSSSSSRMISCIVT